jgi:hypothetical protein
LLLVHSVISQAEEEMGRGNYKTTLESRIYPSKTQRGISLYDLALFAGNFRLVIRVQGLVFKLVGWNRKGRPLGNGVTVHNGSKPGHNRLILQGKVGKFTGSSRFNAWRR